MSDIHQHDRHRTFDTPEMAEPTIWDWVKSCLRGRPLPLPVPAEEAAPAASDTEIEPGPAEFQVPPGIGARRPRFRAAQLRLPMALFLAFTAQLGLERRLGSAGWSLLLYLAAAALVAWAMWEQDFELPGPLVRPSAIGAFTYRPAFLALAVVTFGLTYLTSGDNLFDGITVTLWFVSIVAILYAFWEGELPHRAMWRKVRGWRWDAAWRLEISTWTWLVLAALAVSMYFRVARLAEVPPEMVSDHAEKLLDVVDVLNGTPRIFFPRNTGREALQFYMAAATAKWLGTGISHLTLKIGTVAAGLITLPFIYLLGREIAGRETGLAAMALAAIGYWPNVISRVGLRFPLYPLFVAPAFYLLVRGLRRGERNTLLLCGLTAGAGLHGYSPTRVLPLVIAFGAALWLMHGPSKGRRLQVLTWLVTAGLVGLVVLAPLLRIAIDNPELVNYRMATRMGSAERPLPGPAWQIFLTNAAKALAMFAWDNGEVWVNSIPHRPALDWITGGFFHMGLVLLAVRYARKRRWEDLFLVLSIPLLQLPSTLSLAFPSENPATNRAAGAIVPVFLAAGLAMASIPSWFRKSVTGPRSRLYGGALALAIFALAARANYRLVFVEYQNLYRLSAWNTSDAGAVIRGFATSIGSFDTAHVVAYPHWMDTRLVAMNAGVPTRDYAISPEQFHTLQEESRPQLLLLHLEDADSLAALQQLFPQGYANRWTSRLPSKDFVIFFIPPSQALGGDAKQGAGS